MCTQVSKNRQWTLFERDLLTVMRTALPSLRLSENPVFVAKGVFVSVLSLPI